MLYVRGSHFFLSLAVIFFVVSCGKNGGHEFIRKAKLKPYTVDAEVFMEFSSELDFGNMVVPSAAYTIKHPHANAKIGRLEISNIAGGNVELLVVANVSVWTGIRSSRPRLPNGAMVPLVGSNEAIEVPIASTAARFYGAIFDGAAALGVAVPVKAFDVLGKKVGTTSLFPLFNLGGVIGSAGLFTSGSKGGNGFGVFADISSLVSGSQKRSLQRKARSMIELQTNGRARLDYREYNPSGSKRKRIDRELLKLSRKRARLTVR